MTAEKTRSRNSDWFFLSGSGLHFQKGSDKRTTAPQEYFPHSQPPGEAELSHSTCKCCFTVLSPFTYTRGLSSSIRNLSFVTEYNVVSLYSVPSGSPRGADVAVYVFDSNQPSVPTTFIVLVSVSVFMAPSTVFHSINTPDYSPLSHSVLPVLFLPYWSFQLYIYISLYERLL